jgi:hypothetical protein
MVGQRVLYGVCDALVNDIHAAALALTPNNKITLNFQLLIRITLLDVLDQYPVTNSDPRTIPAKQQNSPKAEAYSSHCVVSVTS